MSQDALGVRVGHGDRRRSIQGPLNQDSEGLLGDVEKGEGPPQRHTTQQLTETGVLVRFISRGLLSE